MNYSKIDIESKNNPSFNNVTRINLSTDLEYLRLTNELKNAQSEYDKKYDVLAKWNDRYIVQCTDNFGTYRLVDTPENRNAKGCTVVKESTELKYESEYEGYEIDYEQYSISVNKYNDIVKEINSYVGYNHIAQLKEKYISPTIKNQYIEYLNNGKKISVVTDVRKVVQFNEKLENENNINRLPTINDSNKIHIDIINTVLNNTDKSILNHINSITIIYGDSVECSPEPIIQNDNTIIYPISIRKAIGCAETIVYNSNELSVDPSLNIKNSKLVKVWLNMLSMACPT